MGENPAEKRIDIPLGDALKEVMSLAEKYKFSFDDTVTLGERLIALGEAVTIITEMGMYEEYVKRLREKIKLQNEAVFDGKIF